VAGSSTFVGVRIQGGLLPAELLSRLSVGQGSSEVGGLGSADYGLAHGEMVREAANRVWAYLTTVWASYRKALAELPETDRATTVTRDRWLQIMLDQFGYGRVPLTGAGGITLGDKSFPVSHLWGPVPIHLLGERIELDKRTAGVAGAAGQAPQSLVQELLNRSDQHLWAILSNGSTLRLLRDSTSLVGSAYVEFDLEAIFESELFSDFLMLYTLCHSSRLAVRDDELGPASCWLESWREVAFESGSRALEQLRQGVVEALEALGSGFLGHPDNATLRDRVESGELGLSDYNHALLRVVYRLLFSFVAEDRGVLLSPDADPVARRRYLDYFSADRLRRTSRRRRGGRHGDRWRALQVVWTGLGSSEGRPELGIAGVGGLYEPGELDFLGSASLSNESLLQAVRSLSVVTEQQSGFKRVVDHRNLGAEELGSIYESLLEYVPSWDAAARAYRLGDAAGNTRKTTGSYYTPTSLIESLLDTALDPVLDEAEKADEPELALLALTVCDPACGSGHFLVGAARRIAKRVAKIRTGDPEPPPEQVRSALREVVGRCIYGVDVNPLAAELAKVSLWLEAMEPGKPLTFLDAQIKVGNALVGTTPALLDAGVPQGAFKPIEGDDRRIASSLKRLNREEAAGQGTLFDADEVRTSNATLVAHADGLTGAGPSLADVHVQQQRLRSYLNSEEYRDQRLIADAWCATFVWRKATDAPSGITNGTLDRLRVKPDSLAEDRRSEVERLAAEYRFFHWHLEFPHVFPTERPATGGSINPVTGWYGGFTVVLGNPPWERVKLQEQEFFASRDPEIANARNAAARKKLIAELPSTNPGLYAEFAAAKRRAEGESHVLRNSGRFPLTGRGDINTYAVFAEGNKMALGGAGRLGIIVPTGIATDATTQYFFKDLVTRRSLSSLYDFQTGSGLWQEIGHSTFKFCLLTLVGRDLREPASDFAFFARSVLDLHRPDVRFELTPDEIALLNPNTGTCPVFRSRRDAEITLGIYRRVPVLINESDPVNGNPWGVKFMTMFHMSNDSHLFHTREELEADGWTLNGNIFERGARRVLPLYEAKMIHLYDHRWATYERDGSTRDVTREEKSDPAFVALPRYWVLEKNVNAKLVGKWDQPWILAWRRITKSQNERTFIVQRLSGLAYGDSIFIMVPTKAPDDGFVLQSALSSFVLDYVARQKLGGTNTNFFLVGQWPIASPEFFRGFLPWDPNVAILDWLTPRVRRLNSPGWSDVDRDGLRAELDAAFFHLYGITRDDADYILDTFPIVKRKDEAAYGEYRTKRLILEAYDRLGVV
jgi:hypothetical protein